MALGTSTPTVTEPLRSTDGATDVRSTRVPPSGVKVTAALLVAAGLFTAAGGAMHPQASGSTVEAHLLSMFASPHWPLAHVLLLVGAVAGFLAMVSAWRTRAFGVRVQRWLPLVIAGWGFGALELVPHLLAAGDAHALAHHGATPVLDLHMLMQTIASPAVGLTGALLAVVVARAAGTRMSWVLAAFAVVGGVASGAAGPLTVLLDARFAVLFPFQAGIAVWVTGTGVRLLRR
jgi:hypothetical protein